MDAVSGLFNKAMGKLVFPDSHGSCALLPRVTDELEELKHLQSTDSDDFPGSAMSYTPRERRIWMSEIYQDRPIGQIVWPATNKSATNKIGITFITRPFGQHQTLSIYYQLRNGVRALDIRVQQDSLVCNGNILSYSIADVIKDIRKFMLETQHEIIVLEIQTERGYRDPPNFESYLVEQLGDLLINQDDHVFSKTISQLLPRRIICIWKPKNSPMPRAGSPIWSASYMRGDEFETELPLTKFNANLIHLSQQTSASERNYFYKVEHILTPHVSSAREWMLVWPRLANFVSKRINDFARLFLAKCNSQVILDRLQIYSTDFVSDDFIIACIALNYSMDIKEQCSQSEETTESSSRENMKQALKEEIFTVEDLKVQLEKTKLDSTEIMQEAVSKEKNRATQIQRDLDELKNKFKDEKVRMEAAKNSILIENETLMRELGDARMLLENMQKLFQEEEVRDPTTPSENENIFMVLARDFLVEDHSGWKWSYLTETSSTAVVEVLDLLQVHWLKVYGQFSTENLTTGIKYEVAFVVMLKNSASGWENPVNLLLTLPDGTRQRNQENLNLKAQEKWIELPVGSFIMSSNMSGNITVMLEERVKELKKGLVIKGVVIQMKYKTEIVFPRDLVISSYENRQCWKWECLYERDEAVEVAELIKVSRLKVSGKFEISSLLPGFTYEVAYVIMLKKTPYEWKDLVNLTLLLPNGKKVEREESLEKYPREEWIAISVGIFEKTGRESGFVQFSLFNFDETPKIGLLIKSVVIQQKIFKTSASDLNYLDVV